MILMEIMEFMFVVMKCQSIVKELCTCGDRIP